VNQRFGGLFYKALENAKKYEICRSINGQYYSSPAVKLAKIEEKEFTEAGIAPNLSEDWPWWSIDGSEKVKAEMQNDPRWTEWVKRTKQ